MITSAMHRLIWSISPGTIAHTMIPANTKSMIILAQCGKSSSLFPILASFLVSYWPRFPVVVMDPAVEVHLPEGHLHRHAYLHLIRVAIGEIKPSSATTLKVYKSGRAWWVDNVRKQIEGESKDRSLLIGKSVVVKFILGLTYDAYPGWRHAAHAKGWLVLWRATTLTLLAVEAEDFLAAALQRCQ